MKPTVTKDATCWVHTCAHLHAADTLRMFPRYDPDKAFAECLDYAEGCVQETLNQYYAFMRELEQRLQHLIFCDNADSSKAKRVRDMYDFMCEYNPFSTIGCDCFVYNHDFFERVRRSL